MPMSLTSVLDRKFLLCGILLLFLSGASSLLLAQDEFVFTDDFESSNRTVVAGAVVQLRDASGNVKAERTAADSGAFQQFPGALIEAGDQIVVFGGFWNGEPFAGEFRLLMTGPADRQTVTPITTLVTAVSRADFVSGATPAARLGEAIARMVSLGMIANDWNAFAPSRIGSSLDAQIDAAGGIVNWTNLLVDQIGADQIRDPQMPAFPYANAGVIDVLVPDGGLSWLTGEVLQVELDPEPLRETDLGWSWTLIEGPTWMQLNPDGVLGVQTPDTASTGTFRVALIDDATSLTREFELPYEVKAGTVVASEIIGSEGGQVWSPDGAFGVEVPANALASTAEFQLVDYDTPQGETRTRFRIVPADTELQEPLRILFGAGLRGASATRGTTGAAGFPCEEFPVDELTDQLLEGWNPRNCIAANFFELSYVTGGGGITGFTQFVKYPLQRAPAGGSLADPLVRPSDIDVRPSSVLLSRCTPAGTDPATSCQGRTPVLFVHGFRLGAAFGGGLDYWEDLPNLLHEFQGGTRYAVYDFRYRSNARFKDIAEDLAANVQLISSETGQKVRIIAHSFGGLVSRTYLQGLAGSAGQLPSFQSCDASRHPYVESLVTVGTPHSGVADGLMNINGIWLPRGRHHVPGALISKCKSLTCWQAGAEEAFASLPVNARAIYDAGPVGGIIADLADFEMNPLSVPTLALMSLRGNLTAIPGLDPITLLIGRTLRTYQHGDGLISYQGQRFSPALSCDSSGCDSGLITGDTVTEISGQPLGHCMTEEMLGGRPWHRPFPGARVFKPGPMHVEYTHTDIAPLRAGRLFLDEMQVVVDQNDHLPALNPDLSGSWASTHDAMNRILAWLAPGENQARVNLTISGQGSVEVIPDWAGPIVCSGSCSVEVPAGIATLSFQPAAGAEFERVSSNCEMFSGTDCEIDVLGWTDVKVDFRAGNETQLTVTLNGSGSVDVAPLGVQCSDPVCSYTLPENTALTLTPASGAFVNWSGFCNVIGNECLLDSGAAGSQPFVTANFLPLPPPPNLPINDTGIDWCADASRNNLACPVVGFPSQDGEVGRDAMARMGQLNKIGAGVAGFDFTKLDANGNALPSTATSWSCVRDNHTRLIWEIKTDDGGLHDKDSIYSWYNPDSATNGGDPGTRGGGACSISDDQFCDTHFYVASVNARGLCGANDWRLPSINELVSVAKYDGSGLAIDTGYFPNTLSSYFWTASPRAGNSADAWVVRFNDGLDFWDFKSSSRSVRLVRGGR